MYIECDEFVTWHSSLSRRKNNALALEHVAFISKACLLHKFVAVRTGVYCLYIHVPSAVQLSDANSIEQICTTSGKRVPCVGFY